MSGLKGRVAIVTGASSGIGLAVARRFAREGARVVAVARRADRLTELAQELPNVTPSVCDLRQGAEIAACVTHAIESFGKIDILVNNAGFSYYKRHEESTLEEWRDTQIVNAEAMYLFAKGVAPSMREHGYGRIVNVSSTQSIRADQTVGAYAASKGAINAWSRALAADLAEYGVLVNVVAPGAVMTEMAVHEGHDFFADPDFQEWYVRRRKIPLGRPGTSEEVANAVAFLSGDQCGYITGQVLVVDGGLTITY